MKCNSCTFPFMPNEKTKECEACGKSTHTFCLVPKEDKMVCDVCLVLKTEEKKSFEFTEDHIRRTDIETYRKCPKKFYMEKIEGLQQPARPYTQVGIDLHEIFEKAVLDRDYFREKWEADYELEYLPKQREAGIYANEEEEKNFIARARACMDTFEEVLPSIPKAFMTEQTIFFEISPELPKVRFTMDLVTENENGGLDLHDWKTGKELVGKQLAEDLQAPIYIYGVEKETGRRVDSFTFYYLKDKKVRKFERLDDNTFVCRVGKREYFVRFNEMIGQLQGIFTQIKKGNFNVPNNAKGMFFTCKMCHIKEQGLCKGANDEAWGKFG